jgi:hypothetical protein
MLERMAVLEKCPLVEVRSRVEESTEAKDHILAFLSLEGKARIIRELEVK